jgi:hypothetical protein
VRALVFVFVLCGGCLDSFSGNDMALDGHLPTDLRGADYSGFYNCLGLNQCLVPCQNSICVSMCRANATPSALMTEDTLQACFDRQCGGPCTPDKTTAACHGCLMNAQATNASTCNPPGASECTQCMNEALACRADKN